VNAWTVAVHTDGFGSFQARCNHCAWRSGWFEGGSREVREGRAVMAAKEHGAGHAASDRTSGSVQAPPLDVL
jgi:hypothetical protein